MAKKPTLPTLKARLAWWYFLSVSLVVGVFFFFASLLTQITLNQQINHHLQVVLDEATQAIRDLNHQDLLTNLGYLTQAKGMTAILLSADGSSLFETNLPTVVPEAEHKLKQLFSSSFYDLSEPYFFEVKGVKFAGRLIQTQTGPKALAVGYSTQVITETLIRLGFFTLGLIGFLVVPLAFTGYLQLKKQLLPLEKIAKEARVISQTGNHKKRLDSTPPTSELLDIEQALNQLLERLDRIISQERDFFAQAAHALKTPLALIQAQVEASQMKKSQKNELNQTIKQAQQLISKLLLLAQVSSQSKKTKKFSLSKLLKDLTELARVLGKEQDLEVISKIEDNVKLKANPFIFKKAMANIVHNAVIYNRPKGKIYLELYQDKTKVMLKVENTGKGLKPKELKQVFERFWRGKNARSTSGSGLGLALTKSVITKLGGKIKFSSTPNQTTSVLISLPTKN